MAGGGGGKDSVNLNLTPMIDILTTLLFFLLCGYQSQAESVKGGESLDLPRSISEKGLSVSLTVIISLDTIQVEGNEALQMQEGKLQDKHIKDNKVIPLYNLLTRLLEQEKMNQLQVDKSAVLLAADRRLTSDVVTKVMKTCGMAGIPNFRLAVAKQD